MKVAALQMVTSTRWEHNRAQAWQLLQQAAAAGAELAVLPEYFCLMGQRDTDKLALAEAFGEGPMQQFLADSARSLGLWIVGGTLPLQGPDADHVYNSSCVYNPQGDCVLRYDKMHLFCYANERESYDEHRVIAPGSTPVQFDLPSRDGQSWCIGLSICYDLRFPELYRLHAQAGAQLMLVPSAFTYTTGQAHWELLLRARAVENLAYVLAAAQGGQHENGRRTWGHSMAINPWGEVMALQASEPGVVLAELDWAQLQRWRQQLPALQHRVC
ncbi:carbon-nitrogen hydrolase family protein [Comamonas sp.]|uniref:carbon-nitrogen hydrolase family protein n=1 Tax=Comamonas sp. TaxID=34028 RepID=UPI00289F0C1D|nr:carbon-nitrogen hydrolase family protein [Comamonas sp.]